jgi:3-hydroxyacyl-CoA dehydrogenase/enoyl-CoA hydratase/3-hydroxybutyryl-CoA epimerase/3-hydroxyacyl-CoA dehydrogenase/enoyl-CoA hydratase/3-hydroxybutyryl-CoA epimerase/enoyl-CoA isomerase
MSTPSFRFDVLPSGIGHLVFDTPGSKVNTLGQAIQSEIEALLEMLEKRGDLKGLLLSSGKPGMFIAGADLKELGQTPDSPETARRLVQRGLDFIRRFETLPYPTAALIDGACMGGGLEWSLGFDYRLAGTHAKTDIGLPETKIGLIPGWGGTQRLSRVLGPNLAMDMICSGEPVKATRAQEIGLVFEAIASDKLVEEGQRVLQWSLESGDWKRQRRKKEQPAGLTEDQLHYAVAVARGQVLAKTKGHFPAPLAAIDAIGKGCNLPLEEGLKVEMEYFLPLLGSPISRNLIALFFLNQKLAKDPGVPDANVRPREVRRVGVIGAGIMGAGIAGAHIRRGVPVTLLDVDAQAVEKGVAANIKVMQSRIDIGRMSHAEMVQALGRLSTATQHAPLAECDVVLEAVVEKEDVKTTLFRDLQKVLRPGTILASNTSTISITRMAQAWTEPERFAGMHFFNPVDRMQLVEVIRGEKTSDETTATLVALAKRTGKSPIVVRDCPGFLVNRILFPYINEAMALLEEGADPRAIDKAATTFGMPMGPITLSDVVGLDTTRYAGKVVNDAFADRAKDTRILGKLVEAGRLGQKSGAGFYSYAKGPRGIDDPALAAILAAVREKTREIGQEEITDRLFLSMLVEASRVLSEGIVRDAADVDMGLILGIGFPTFRGGLLRWADSIGLPAILQRLEKYVPLGKRFEPTDTMRSLANAGKGFFRE